VCALGFNQQYCFEFFLALVQDAVAADEFTSQLGAGVGAFRFRTSSAHVARLLKAIACQGDGPPLTEGSAAPDAEAGREHVI